MARANTNRNARKTLTIRIPGTLVHSSAKAKPPPHFHPQPNGQRERNHSVLLHSTVAQGAASGLVARKATIRSMSDPQQ